MSKIIELRKLFWRNTETKTDWSRQALSSSTTRWLRM